MAVKVLTYQLAHDPKALSRFESETKAVAALSYPSVLSLLDAVEANGIRYARHRNPQTAPELDLRETDSRQVAASPSL